MIRELPVWQFIIIVLVVILITAVVTFFVKEKFSKNN